MFIMNDIESQDIDTEFDFKTTELLQDLSIDNIKKIVLITGVNGGVGTEIAKKFKSDREGFNKIAREWTQKYAT